MEKINTLIVIPARGGSKGIPRKSLRPLAGYPLISYSIKAAKSCNQEVSDITVVVTTDDDEMALISNRFGAEVILRGEDLSSDSITLDPVICDAVKKIEDRHNKKFDLIITVQPTSPLVKNTDIENCIDIFLNNKNIETVISVVDDRHLRWRVENNKALPDYERRVNRQSLPLAYKETGAVIACRREMIETGSRIGDSVELLEIPYERSFDIDSMYDWYICENILKKKKIVFHVIGYPIVGLGHVYRTLMLASELILHDVIFVVDENSLLAAEQIKKFNYTVHITKSSDIIKEIQCLSPDLVINDILDTNEDYMNSLKKIGCKIINFEDLGSGIDFADIVINALYSDDFKGNKKIKSGPEFFCLRDEFLFSEVKQITSEIKRVLLTFGGVDEGDLTRKVLDSILCECIDKNILIDIVVGPGYKHLRILEEYIESIEYKGISLIKETKRISDFMLKADLAITSGGRTVLELASLAVPSIVICQNERETTHTFADFSHGIINLGYREKVSQEKIRSEFSLIIKDKDLRNEMIRRMRVMDLSKGKSKVMKLINDLIN